MTERAEPIARFERVIPVRVGAAYLLVLLGLPAFGVLSVDALFEASQALASLGFPSLVVTLVAAQVATVLGACRELCKRYGTCLVRDEGLEFGHPVIGYTFHVGAARVEQHVETPHGYEVRARGRLPLARLVSPLLLPCDGDPAERARVQQLLERFYEQRDEAG